MAKERRTLHAGVSGSSVHSRIPNYYLIWQEAVTHCISKDLCEAEVSKCERHIGVCAASKPTKKVRRVFRKELRYLSPRLHALRLADLPVTWFPKPSSEGG